MERKFVRIETGIVYIPAEEVVIEQMAASPLFEEVTEKPKPKRTRTTKAKPKEE